METPFRDAQNVCVHVYMYINVEMYVHMYVYVYIHVYMCMHRYGSLRLRVPGLL